MKRTYTRVLQENRPNNIKVNRRKLHQTQEEQREIISLKPQIETNRRKSAAPPTTNEKEGYDLLGLEGFNLEVTRKQQKS